MNADLSKLTDKTLAYVLEQLERKVAVIDFDPNQSHLDDFLRAVLKAGFRVS